MELSKLYIDCFGLRHQFAPDLIVDGIIMNIAINDNMRILQIVAEGMGEIAQTPQTTPKIENLLFNLNYPQ